jgi:hypothetical protein
MRRWLATGIGACLSVGCSDDPVRDATATTPAAVAPDVVPLLPPVSGYGSRDDVDVHELKESLAHAALAVDAVDRRLIVDDHGLTMGEVILIVFPNDTPDQDYVAAVFPQARTETVEIAENELTRVVDNGLLVWDRGSSVVVFQRAQEQTDEWLRDLASATISAMTD